MRLPFLALSSALAAAVLALSFGVFGDVVRWVVPGVLTVLVGLFAVGWPRMLGAPSRKSLSVALFIPAAVALWLLALVPADTSFTGHVSAGQRPDLWLAPLAALMALGAIGAFLVQLVRGQGKPYRLESTAGTMVGVVITCASAVWVLLARLDPAVLVDWHGVAGMTNTVEADFRWALVCLLLGHIVSAGLGALPGSLVLRVVLMTLAGAAVPFGFYGGLPVLSDPSSVATLSFVVPLCVAGALAGAVGGLMRAVEEQSERVDQPGRMLPVLSLGLAPVMVAGTVMYFVLWLLPPVA